MDMEEIVQEYTSQMKLSELKEPHDLVTPWFQKEFCFNEGYLLPRCTVGLVAIVGLVASAIEFAIITKPPTTLETNELLQSAKLVLITLFLIVNLLLFIGTIMEHELFVKLYLWYTPGFVIFSLTVALMEFVIKAAAEGTTRNRNCYLFMVEIAYLFTIARCLPLVNKYFRQITF